MSSELELELLPSELDPADEEIIMGLVDEGDEDDLNCLAALLSGRAWALVPPSASVLFSFSAASSVLSALASSLSNPVFIFSGVGHLSKTSYANTNKGGNVAIPTKQQNANEVLIATVKNTTQA